MANLAHPIDTIEGDDMEAPQGSPMQTERLSSTEITNEQSPSPINPPNTSPANNPTTPNETTPKPRWEIGTSILKRRPSVMNYDDPSSSPLSKRTVRFNSAQVEDAPDEDLQIKRDPTSDTGSVLFIDDNVMAMDIPDPMDEDKDMQMQTQTTSTETETEVEMESETIDSEGYNPDLDIDPPSPSPDLPSPSKILPPRQHDQSSSPLSAVPDSSPSPRIQDVVDSEGYIPTPADTDPLSRSASPSASPITVSVNLVDKPTTSNSLPFEPMTLQSTKEADALLLSRRPTTDSLTTLADMVNERLDTKVWDARRVYSRLVMLNASSDTQMHQRGTLERTRVTTGTINAASSSTSGNKVEWDRRDDEVLALAYAEARDGFWDLVAGKVRGVTGKEFSKGDVEGRFRSL